MSCYVAAEWATCLYILFLAVLLCMTHFLQIATLYWPRFIKQSLCSNVSWRGFRTISRLDIRSITELLGHLSILYILWNKSCWQSGQTFFYWIFEEVMAGQSLNWIILPSFTSLLYGRTLWKQPAGILFFVCKVLTVYNLAKLEWIFMIFVSIE